MFTAIIRHIGRFIAGIGIALMILIGATFVQGASWFPPAGKPPKGNIPEVFHVGPGPDQIKLGTIGATDVYLPAWNDGEGGYLASQILPSLGEGVGDFNQYHIETTRIIKNSAGNPCLPSYVCEVLPGEVGVCNLQSQCTGAVTESDHLYPLDQVVTDMCKDQDGCEIVLAIKDWDTSKPGRVTVVGPYRFFIAQDTDWWETSDGNGGEGGENGHDGDGLAERILKVDDCELSDADEPGGTWGADTGLGYGLYNNAGTSPPPLTVTCVLDVRD